MKMTRKAGIITPFAAVSMVLIVSLVFVLLEGTRMQYGEKLCAQQAQYAAQTFLGQYHVELQKRYGVYGVDERLYENKESFLTDVGMFQTGPVGGSFLNPEGNSLKELKFRLLTDDGGADFRKQAMESYLYHLPAEHVEQLKQQLAIVSGLGDEQTERNIINSAEVAIEEAERLTEEENEAQNHRADREEGSVLVSAILQNKSKEEVENPIETMKRQKASFSLSIVLPENFTLSTAGKRQDTRLEDRAIENGTMDADGTPMVNEKLLFPLYLADTFQNALSETQRAEADGLQYQMEYFLVGKDSDAQNLEGVVQRLILMREMTWFVHRLADGTSLPAARSIATVLACGLALPVLIEPIAIAIVLAWAYADAIQDVRSLLSGNEVPLIPQGKSQKNNANASNGLWMLSYEDYLLLLVAMKNTETVTFRALDMVQETLVLAGYEFIPERIVTGIEGTILYDYEGLFLNWVAIACPNIFPIQIEAEFRESYCP